MPKNPIKITKYRINEGKLLLILKRYEVTAIASIKEMEHNNMDHDIISYYKYQLYLLKKRIEEIEINIRVRK